MAYDFIGAVAGNFGEGPVDPQDGALCIGDGHALLGLEGSGGDAKRLLGLLALGDVSGQDDKTLLLPLAHRLAGNGQFKPGPAVRQLQFKLLAR